MGAESYPQAIHKNIQVTQSKMEVVACGCEKGKPLNLVASPYRWLRQTCLRHSSLTHLEHTSKAGHSASHLRLVSAMMRGPIL